MFKRFTETDDDLRVKARKLVNALAEDEDEGFDKDFAPSLVDLIANALIEAGFKIGKTRFYGDKFSFEFTWPYTTTASYINGGKRAKEVITQFTKLRTGDLGFTKFPNLQTAMGIVTKKIERNPGLWEIESLETPVGHHGYWFVVYYKKQEVGEFYLNSYSGPENTQEERVREEMSELDSLVPFIPEQWPSEGDAFGSGPAIEWWRRNRSQLFDAEINDPYFTKSLTH